MEYQAGFARIQKFVEEARESKSIFEQRRILNEILRVSANSNVLPFDAIFSLTSSTNISTNKPHDKSEAVKVSDTKPQPIKSVSSGHFVCPVCNEGKPSAYALNGHMKKHRNKV